MHLNVLIYERISEKDSWLNIPHKIFYISYQSNEKWEPYLHFPNLTFKYKDIFQDKEW